MYKRRNGKNYLIFFEMVARKNKAQAALDAIFNLQPLELQVKGLAEKGD